MRTIKAMAYGMGNGKQLTDIEYEEHQRGIEPLSQDQGGQGLRVEEEEQARQRAEALVRKIGEACDELERLAEENPELVGRVTRSAEEPRDAYLRLRARLELADAAPRCRWVRQDGTSCGSPQVKKHIYCFAHRQMMEARALMLALPAAEDANAIQIGLMRLQKAMIDDTISMKKAGLLLYSMQLALQNVGRTTFGQAKTEELVTETVDEREAISQNQKLFTTEDTKDTEEEQGLPRINADERGLENPKPIFWKPTPDMYRLDTPEGREAYEARFGTSQNQKLFTTEGTKDTEEEQGVPRINADERGLENPSPIFWKPTPDMYRMDTPEGREAYEARFGMKIEGTKTVEAISQNQKLFTTEGTKDTEKNQGLPRMNSDGRVAEVGQTHANLG
jgi:hypothetical protein